MKSGMTMYSFNTYAREGRIDVPGFIRLAAELGLESVDLLAYYWHDERHEPEDALALLDEVGVELAAYAVGNNFVQEDEARFREQVDIVRRGIEMTARLGAPVLRVFGGHAPNMPREEAMKLARAGLEAVAEEAGKAKVVLAVENHGGTPATAAEVAQLLDVFDSPWVRACVDVGNFVGVEDDIVDAVARVVGYAAHVHVKDSKPGADGRMQSCIPGQGVLPYDRILPVFAEAGYEGALAIEAEGPEDDLESARYSSQWLRQLLGDLRAEG